MAGYATPSWANNSAPAIDATAMTDIGQGIEIAEHPYGVCTTASNTAAKTVTVDFSGTLTLFTGMEVRVKFDNANTASSPTLNVNSTGAKSIMLYGTTNAGSGAWIAGDIVTLIYDGTNWIMGSQKQITANTPTSLSGVLSGDGSTVGTATVDSAPQQANTTHLLASSGALKQTQLYVPNPRPEFQAGTALQVTLGANVDIDNFNYIAVMISIGNNDAQAYLRRMSIIVPRSQTQNNWVPASYYYSGTVYTGAVQVTRVSENGVIVPNKLNITVSFTGAYLIWVYGLI